MKHTFESSEEPCSRIKPLDPSSLPFPSPQWPADASLGKSTNIPQKVLPESLSFLLRLCFPYYRSSCSCLRVQKMYASSSLLPYGIFLSPALWLRLSFPTISYDPF